VAGVLPGAVAVEVPGARVAQPEDKAVTNPSMIQKRRCTGRISPSG